MGLTEGFGNVHTGHGRRAFDEHRCTGSFDLLIRVHEDFGNGERLEVSTRTSYLRSEA